MQTQYPCQNLGIRIKEYEDTLIQSRRFPTDVPKESWKLPRTTSSDCHSNHTTVNVFPGVVECEDPEGRQMADEGKVCHLVDSFPLTPRMLQ